LKNHDEKTDEDLVPTELVRRNQERVIRDKFQTGDLLRQALTSMAAEKGAFTRWLRDEFNMTRQAANSLMQISAAVVPQVREIVARNFDIGSVYELCRSQQGESALAIAIQRAQQGEHISAGLAKRLLQGEARAVREQSVVTLPKKIRIEKCGIQELKVEPGTVDMILTDPPYDEASVPLYEAVAKFAAGCLRPGGWCLAYAGKMYLARIHFLMKKHLEYTFQFDVPHERSTLIESLGIEQNGKYIVGYRFDPQKPWWTPVCDRVCGVVEKTLHKWQQPIEEAEQLISGLCPEGGIVCDPMCGSGTTLAAALKLGRQVIGADVDPEAVLITKQRLATLLQ
jgi:hypothetical protein